MSCWLLHDWMGWSDPVELESRQIVQVRMCRRCRLQKVREIPGLIGKEPPSVGSQGTSESGGR